MVVSVVKMDINGKQVGIMDLEDIFREAASSGLKDAEQLKDLILEKVKAKNYVPSSQEKKYREDLYEEYRVSIGELKERARTSTAVEVRLYGASCSQCEKLNAMVLETLSRAGIPVDYQYITDTAEAARAGIISPPALTVSGALVVFGQVPSGNQLEKALLQAIDKAKGNKA